MPGKLAPSNLRAPPKTPSPQHGCHYHRPVRWPSNVIPNRPGYRLLLQLAGSGVKVCLLTGTLASNPSIQVIRRNNPLPLVPKSLILQDQLLPIHANSPLSEATP